MIALVTFVTSFDAITATAAATGAVSARLAWAVPIAIDGLILVGSAVAWTEAIDDDWHPFPLLTVGGAAGLSVWANVAHAAGAPPLGQVLAAVPPIALIVSVELGAWQVRRSFKRTRLDAAEEAAAEEAAAEEAAAEEALAMALMDDEHDFAEQNVDGEYDEAAEYEDAPARERHEPAGPPGYERVPQALPRYTPERERQPQPRLADAPARAPVAPRASAMAPRASAMAPRASQNSGAQSDTGESDGELMQQIAAHVTEVGHRPTQREIAEALGLTRSNVRRAINAEPEVWHRLGRLTTAGNGQGTPAAR